MPKTTCRPWSGVVNSAVAANIARLCVFAALLGASAVATAQAVLYKWNDAAGKTHYGDRPPKDALNLTRIEVDSPATVVGGPLSSPPRLPGEKTRSDKVEEKAPADVATQRRDLRNRLEASLEKARDKLEAAKRALAEAEPGDDERQTIQQRRPSDTGGNGAGTTAEGRQVGGMLGMAPRINCREVEGRNNQRVVVCPTFVPNEKYTERIAQLEEAVRLAEEEVAAAEYAYRRGVD